MNERMDFPPIQTTNQTTKHLLKYQWDFIDVVKCLELKLWLMDVLQGKAYTKITKQKE